MPEILPLGDLVGEAVDEVAEDLHLDPALARDLVARLLTDRVVYLPPVKVVDPNLAPDAEARSLLAKFAGAVPGASVLDTPDADEIPSDFEKAP